MCIIVVCIGHAPICFWTLCPQLKSFGDEFGA